ncbi:MAG: LacI family DNA-binding transcriptional regulator [Eubacteriales bacterium]|nr:LacI family DNA-binding transcriptional regulator [Eubacteriales bacterium]
MLTIKEVAELAGVSKSTVSRVLNNNGYVNEETRRRIEKVIQEYGYRPSAAAVTLSKKEGSTIGVIIPEIDNTFFGEVLKGINEVADRNDFSIICCDTQNNGEKELKALAALEQQRVRGVIITPAMGYGDRESVEKLKEALARLDVPVVVVDRDFDYSQWDTVYYQNYESGFIATESLIRAGNRTIGIIQGDMQLKIARERYRGYEDAMMANGLEIPTEFVLKGDFSQEKAYELTCAMVEGGVLPDAMVTCNNRTSLGFIKAMIEHGLAIGKDIAVVGIDHLPVLDVLGFHFSCVSRDTIEMGRMGMKLLMERMKSAEKQRAIWVAPCKLELKGSEKTDK